MYINSWTAQQAPPRGGRHGSRPSQPCFFSEPFLRAGGRIGSLRSLVTARVSSHSFGWKENRPARALDGKKARQRLGTSLEKQTTTGRPPSVAAGRIGSFMEALTAHKALLAATVLGAGHLPRVLFFGGCRSHRGLRTGVR